MAAAGIHSAQTWGLPNDGASEMTLGEASSYIMPLLEAVELVRGATPAAGTTAQASRPPTATKQADVDSSQKHAHLSWVWKTSALQGTDVVDECVEQLVAAVRNTTSMLCEPRTCLCHADGCGVHCLSSILRSDGPNDLNSARLILAELATFGAEVGLRIAGDGNFWSPEMLWAFLSAVRSADSPEHIAACTALRRYCSRAAQVAVVNAVFLHACLQLNLLSPQDVLLEDVMSGRMDHLLPETASGPVRALASARLRAQMQFPLGASRYLRTLLGERSAYDWLYVPHPMVLRQVWCVLRQSRLPTVDILGAVLERLVGDDPMAEAFGRIYTPPALVAFTLKTAGISEESGNLINIPVLNRMDNGAANPKGTSAIRTLLDSSCGAGAFLGKYASIVVTQLARLDEVWNDPLLLQRGLEAIANGVCGIDIDNHACDLATVTLCVATLPLVRRILELLGASAPRGTFVCVPVPPFQVVHGDVMAMERLAFASWECNATGVLPTNPLQINETFDYVVGNPPYVMREHLAAFRSVEERGYFHNFRWWKTSPLYTFFFIHAARHLKKTGTLALVLPPAFLANTRDLQFCEDLLRFVRPDTLYVAPRYTFFKASTEQMIFVGHHPDCPREISGRHALCFKVVDSACLETRPRKDNMATCLRLWEEGHRHKAAYLQRALRGGQPDDPQLLTSVIDLLVLDDLVKTDISAAAKMLRQLPLPGNHTELGSETAVTRLRHLQRLWRRLGDVAKVATGLKTSNNVFLLFARDRDLANVDGAVAAAYNKFLSLVDAEGLLVPAYAAEQTFYAVPSPASQVLMAREGLSTNSPAGAYLAYAQQTNDGTLRVCPEDADPAIRAAWTVARIKDLGRKRTQGNGPLRIEGSAGRGGIDVSRPYILTSKFPAAREDSSHRWLRFGIASGKRATAIDRFNMLQPRDDGAWTNVHALCAFLNSLLMDCVVRFMDLNVKKKMVQLLSGKLSELPIPAEPPQGLDLQGAALHRLYTRAKEIMDASACFTFDTTQSLLALRSVGGQFLATHKGRLISLSELLHLAKPNTTVTDMRLAVEALEKICVGGGAVGDSVNAGAETGPMTAADVLASLVGATTAAEISVALDPIAEGNDRAKHFLARLPDALPFTMACQLADIFDECARYQALVDATVFRAIGGMTEDAAQELVREIAYMQPQAVRVRLARNGWGNGSQSTFIAFAEDEASARAALELPQGIGPSLTIASSAVAEKAEDAPVQDRSRTRETPTDDTTAQGDADPERLRRTKRRRIQEDALPVGTQQTRNDSA